MLSVHVEMIGNVLNGAHTVSSKVDLSAPLPVLKDRLNRFEVLVGVCTEGESLRLVDANP